MPTASSNSITFSFCAPERSPRCCRSVSPTCNPTVRAGLREVCGSWNIMEICPPRISRICRFDSASRSPPLNRMAPLTMADFGNKRVKLSAVTDLPLPDSPSRARVSPSSIRKSTPSTAWTWWPSVVNLTFSCLTSRSTVI